MHELGLIGLVDVRSPGRRQCLRDLCFRLTLSNSRAGW